MLAQDCRTVSSEAPHLSRYSKEGDCERGISNQGKYMIQLSKPVSDELGAEIVKSNKITITITP